MAPLGRPATPQRYYKVRVTYPRAALVAEWIAEGPVKREREGYRIHAVERVSGPPFVTRSQYPHGRNVYVTGPNIVVTPTGKPWWLYEIDGF
jgi:hypothetical protein